MKAQTNISQTWNPTVRALTQYTPSTNLYPNFAGDALPTWIFGSRVTLVGDAAHAHGGAFAAGGSLALDDSLALGLAFKYVFNSSAGLGDSIEKINKVLSLYNKTRQPHTARLLRIVHNQIEQRASAATSLEEEDAALVARMKKRPNTEWLSEHDVEAAFKAVVDESETGDHLEQTSSLAGLSKPKPPIEGAIQLQKSKI